MKFRCRLSGHSGARKLSCQIEVEGVGTEFDLVIPRDRTVWSDMHRLEDTRGVPSPEHSPTCDV